MGELPEGLRGRILAVLLLITVIGSLWAGIATPLSNWYFARADQVDQDAALLARMQQIAADLPELRRRANTVEAAAPVAVLDGATDAVAGATLQQKLQQIGASVGTTLASTEVLPGEQLGAYRRIAVRLSVTAPWPIIVHLLEAITTGTPRLMVNDLQVQSARGFVNDADPTLTTSMVVFGFRAGKAS